MRYDLTTYEIGEPPSLHLSLSKSDLRDRLDDWFQNGSAVALKIEIAPAPIRLRGGADD